MVKTSFLKSPNILHTTQHLQRESLHIIVITVPTAGFSDRTGAGVADGDLGKVVLIVSGLHVVVEVRHVGQHPEVGVVAGGCILTEDKTRAGFDQPATRRAMDFYLGMQKNDGCPAQTYFAETQRRAELLTHWTL